MLQRDRPVAGTQPFKRAYLALVQVREKREAIKLLVGQVISRAMADRPARISQNEHGVCLFDPGRLGFR